ncbi:protein of unknown function [Pararobbsia alpina]
MIAARALAAHGPRGKAAVAIGFQPFRIEIEAFGHVSQTSFAKESVRAPVRLATLLTAPMRDLTLPDRVCAAQADRPHGTCPCRPARSTRLAHNLANVCRIVQNRYSTRITCIACPTRVTALSWGKNDAVSGPKARRQARQQRRPEALRRIAPVAPCDAVNDAISGCSEWVQ